MLRQEAHIPFQLPQPATYAPPFPKEGFNKEHIAWFIGQICKGV